MIDVKPETKIITVADTIREITRDHLLKNHGIVMGQCLSAVGWVARTVPELKPKDGLIEMSMDDTCSSYMAVGYALAGRRPIYVCRYQGFMWFNAVGFTNYAAKAREIWNYKCPIFIRAISMEGGIGPVAGNSHHGIFIRMPGIPVYAPMTPDEYRHIWEYFTGQDGPVYVSEHRRSFGVNYEMPDVSHNLADLTIYAISSARLNAVEAVKKLVAEGITCNLIHLTWLKPFEVNDRILCPLEASTYGGLILDTDYENGVSKCLAFDIMQRSLKIVRVLGLEEKTAGFAPHLDNLPPTSEKICSFVKKIVNV